jgi:transcriptional regulator with GAF, ATPase, and Fis domain/pSer/pThr/pTyr-binding forkhead associated (FHA) protein
MQTGSQSVPHLTVLSGPTRGKIVVLGAEPCRIGRESTLELSISDSKASRVHVEINCKDGQYILRDLHSKNGTLVNGASVTALTLKEGDQIQVGETRMAFSMQDAPAVPQTKNRQLDSVLAARLPVGVIPTLGSTGMADRNAAEAFETLELNAPLGILRGEAGVSHAAETSDHVAVDINQPLGSALERANRSLRGLFAIARAAAEANSSAELWNALSDGLRSAIEADRVTPVMLDEKGQWFVAEANQKSPLGKGQFSRISVSRTIVDYALRTRRSVLTAPRNDARFGHSKSIGEQGITSAISVPVISHDQVLGVIYADRMGGQDFVREDQELVTAACLQAAPALANLQRLEEALTKKERLLKELKSQHHLLGESPKMKDVSAFIQRAAPTQSVVLVLGESGTGKELVARAIHYNSTRSDAAFVTVNCAALTETLIESELFGHVRGAFTGAAADRPGRFELAHDGTIFLDEIGELSNNCQTKLLRVLEQGEISRVGESRVRKVNVRVVAATNRDLQSEVKAGRFREDLYYRLNVLSISLPALRERGADVPLLLEHYLREAAVRTARPKLEFSEEALQALTCYRWPGNVRELRNLTERIAVLCPTEVIGLADLPVECVAPPATESASAANVEAKSSPSVKVDAPAGSRLADIEKQHILRVLQTCENNKKLAAEKLGIDRSTLYAKLRAYGILAQDTDARA